MNTLNISGNLDDTGTIVVNSNNVSGYAVLNFNGGMLSGNGNVALNNSVYAALNGTLTQAKDHIIHGQGSINAALTNSGTVTANVSGQSIFLRTSAMTNNNVFEAAGGGTLDINGGIIVTQGASGQIRATGTGSVVTVGATISGGTLNGSDGGLFTAIGGTFDSLTNNAVVDIPNNNMLHVTGNLTDYGTIAVDSSGGGTTLTFNGGTLSGTGNVVMSGIGAALNGMLTQAATHMIQGQGAIGATLTNNGTVLANLSSNALSVNGSTTNNGLMRASNHGTLQFGFGALSNLSGTTLTGGSYEVDANSTITLPFATIATNAANVTLGGAGTTFTALNSLTNNSGSLTLASGAAFSPIGGITSSGKIDFDGGGTLSVNSTVTLSSTSTLLFSLSGLTQGTQYGKINVTGALAAAGTLQVTLNPTFAPALGNSFDILDFGSITGIFPTVQLPGLAGGLTWNTSQLYTIGTITVGGVLGDYNHNGIVDAADYTVWRDSLGQTGAGLAADGDGNGVVTSADYNVWKSNFGNHAGSGAGATTAVPEPTTIVLLLSAAMTLLILRRADVS